LFSDLRFVRGRGGYLRGLFCRQVFDLLSPY
jgi:hypothetical protein